MDTCYALASWQIWNPPSLHNMDVWRNSMCGKGVMNQEPYFLVQLQLWSHPTPAADGKDSSSVVSPFEIIPPA
ncbi:hypothetical protein [Absidia glauca]|uniref:Uncharacterized protein n=1 Tax=Absidia glauca TaxID=4829 RepID=A0A168RS10_ABSGL|nr:hypothetical protein [Absidia glauca]